MTITNVDSPEEFRTTLKTKLKAFMEKNEQFNVQGSWEGEDGVTVSVLVDFGIEDRDEGEYYVGTVSSQYQENLEHLEEEGVISKPEEEGATTPEEADGLELKAVLGESDTFEEAQTEMKKAIKSVFDVTSRSARCSPPENSDIDISSTAVIQYGNWDVREDVNYPRKTIRDERESTGKFHVDQNEKGELVQIDEFDSLEEAKAEYPNAEVLG